MDACFDALTLEVDVLAEMLDLVWEDAVARFWGHGMAWWQSKLEPDIDNYRILYCFKRFEDK